MAKLCSWIPQVKTNDGTITDSKLFKGLAIFIKNRETLVDTYNITRAQEFIDNVLPQLELDNAGEPTIDSLLSKTDFSEKIPDKDVINYSYNYITESPTNSYNNNYSKLVELQNKANTFNNEALFRDNYLATVELKDNKLSLKIIKKTAENNTQELQKASNVALNTRLREILEGYNVSVGVLDTLEQAMNLNGITDFTALRKANGFRELIRLAQGTMGELALPEEFSHVILELMQNNPLVKRLINAVNSEEQLKTILGDKYSFYTEAYNNDPSKLAKEAAAHLLALHLIQQQEIPTAPYKSLLQRVIQAFKNFFKSWNADIFNKAIVDTNKEFDSLAKGLLNGMITTTTSSKDISSSEQYYSLEKKISRDSQIVEDMLAVLAKKIKIQEVKNPSSKTSVTARNLLDELELALIDGTEIKAMYSFLDYGLKEIKQLETDLNKATSKGSINDQAAALINIKNHLASYNSIFKTLDRELLKESRKTENRFGDKLEAQLNEMESLQKNLLLRFEETQMPLIKEYLNTFLGDGVKVVLGGKEINLDSIFSEAERDVSLADMWLSSISQTNNDVLKLLGKIYSDTQERKRHRVLDKMKTILALGKKLEQSGIKDTAWMFEEGKKTYITENAAMNLTGDQYEYWQKWMEIKRELDSFLPPNTTRNNYTIKILNDSLERVKNAGSVEGMFKAITENLKDSFIRRSDDVEYSESVGVEDFEGRKVNSIPIYYTKLHKGESFEDISTDTTSALIAYAEMAINYNEMSNVLGIMELMGDKIRQIEPQQTQSNKPLVEIINLAGKPIKVKMTKQSAGSNLVQRLNTFFDMQVCQRYIKDHGDVDILGLKFNTTKAVQKLNRMTSFSNMAFNALSGIANVVNSEAMMRIEASGGQFYNHSNLYTADKIFAKMMPTIVSNLNKRIKTDKASLWAELFNVGSGYEDRIRNIDFNKRSILSKSLQFKHAFVLSNAGEFWASMRNSLAMADAYKVKDSKGNIINLYDALEVEYLDSNNHDLGAKLVVKKGITKLDGSELTTEDFSKFTQKSNELGRYLYGNYDNESKNALQQYALGQSAMMYRKWIVPALKRRYGKKQTNFLLDAETEGYYRTAYNFITNNITDLRAKQFNMIANWNNLSDMEKSNLRKAMTEMGTFAILTMLFAFIDFSDDDDDTWLEKLLEYSGRRLKTELGAIVPNLGIYDEAMKILKAPAANIRTTESIIGTFGLLNPLNYDFVNEDAIIERGKYKGHSEAYKLFMNAPIVNATNQFYRTTHIEDAIGFLEN